MATVTTDPRVHETSAKSTFQTDLRVHETSTYLVQTGLRFHETCSCKGVSTGLRVHEVAQTTSEFEGYRRTFNYKIRGAGAASLDVDFSSSTGGSAALCKGHTLVIAQNASQTQTLSLNLTDPLYQFHPYGGGTYKDVMADGAEVSINVNFERTDKDFFGTFRAPVCSVDGRNHPVMAWPGVGVGENLFKAKRTLSTLNSSPLAPLTTRNEALAEPCELVGVDCNWSGVADQKLGGPFHRQNLTPGQLTEKLLELTVDEWKTRYKTITGYDPDSSGTEWTYSVDDDEVRSFVVTPTNNEVIKGVVVLRAIATGQLQPQEGETTFVEFTEFGEKEVSFNPPISGATVREEYRDYRGFFSNFQWYSGEERVAIRKPFGQLVGAMPVANRIINCDRCIVTWGASKIEFNDVTDAAGGLNFYGRQTPQGEIGEGINAQEPLDPTTRVVRGVAAGAVELPPNPLFYNKAQMENFGDRYLARVGRAQVEHVLRVPLNHLVECGDRVRLELGPRFGNRVLNLLVVGWSHSISAIYKNRFTTIRGVEYL